MLIPNYRQSREEMDRRSIFMHNMYLTCAEHKEEIQKALCSAQSCLSIGPGSGGLDMFVIRMFMPELKDFYAVEPNKENFLAMRENMHKIQVHQSFSVHLFQENPEAWQGLVDTKVDVILCFMMLSHVPDTGEFINKCHSWLKPGGVLWLSHPDDNIIIHRMKDILPNARGNLVEVDVPNILEDTGFKWLAHYTFEWSYCLRQVTKDFLRALICREPTEEDFERFVEFVDKHHGKDDYLNHWAAEVHLCQKLK